MKQIYKLCFLMMIGIISISETQGQISGAKTIPSTNYPTVKVAIDSINAYGVGVGGVVFTITDGHYEYSSIATLYNTSSSNSITFKRSGGGNRPIITAQAGSGAYDGILEVEGTDSVTIDGLELRDTTINSTATTMMEFGVGFFKKDTTDGSSICKVEHCVITLQRTNSYISSGIFAFCSDASGNMVNYGGTGYLSKGFDFNSNTITDAGKGVVVYSANGNYPDENINIIGNNISDCGFGSNINIISTNHTLNTTIKNNQITFYSGITASILSHIYVYSAASNNTTIIQNNTLSGNSNIDTAIFSSIYAGLPNSGNSSLHIDSNTIENISFPNITSGLVNVISVSYRPQFTYINNNTISTISIGNGTTLANGHFYAINTGTRYVSGSEVEISYNNITDITRNQSSPDLGDNYIVYSNPIDSRFLIHHNLMKNSTFNGIGSFYGIYCYQLGSGQSSIIHNNSIDNISRNNYGSNFGIYISHYTDVATFTDSIYNNIIKNFNNVHLVRGIFSNNTGNSYIIDNNIENFNSKSFSFGIHRLGIAGATELIKNNTIIIVDSSSLNSNVYGIYHDSPYSNVGSVKIESNDISGIFPKNITGHIFGIFSNSENYNFRCINNNIHDLTLGDSTGTFSGNLYGIYINSHSDVPTSNATIKGNTIQGLVRVDSIPGSGDMYGIYSSVSASIISINDNLIRQLNQIGSYSQLYGLYLHCNGSENSLEVQFNKVSEITRSNAVNGNTYGMYIYPYNNTYGLLNSNTVSQFSSIGSGSADVVGIYLTGPDSGIWELDNDTIKSFTGLADMSGIRVNGIQTCTIKKCIVSQFNTGSTSVFGIDRFNGSNNVIKQNSIFDLKTNASSAQIVGLRSIASKNYIQNELENNQVFINNHGNSGIVDAYGFVQEMHGIGHQNRYINNTVDIGGNSSNSAYSAPIWIRDNSSNTDLVNNLLINSRKNSNYSYCLWLDSSSSLKSNYQLYSNFDTSKLVRQGLNNYSFKNWRSSFGVDTFSWFAQSHQELRVDSLFMDTTLGDLRINPDYTGSWYANGKGVAGVRSGFLSQDFSGNSRSTTMGMGTDLGAHEFTPNTLPPPATESGTIANGGITTYHWGGREIASILWNGSNLPSQLAVRYFSGTTPPDPTNNGSNPTAKYMNSYMYFAPVGGSNFGYDIRFHFSPALMGNVPWGSTLELSKKPDTGTGAWKVHYDSWVDSSNYWIYMNTLSGFSVFTASDQDNPLPIHDYKFNADVQGTSARISCQLLQAAQQIIVQRQCPNQDWETVHTSIQGNPIFAEYQWLDAHIGQRVPFASYRLIITEMNGDVQVTSKQTLTWNKMSTPRISVTMDGQIQQGWNTDQAMKIVDVTGKQISKSFIGQLIPDYHTLPSGIYFLMGEDGACGRFIRP